MRDVRDFIRSWLGLRDSDASAAEPSSPAKESLSPDQKIYAVGDIHGCRDLLMRLLERIADDFVRDPRSHSEIIFLGDYVDRGVDSRGVVEFLANFPKELPPATCLMGNHEQVFLQFLENPAVAERWRHFGGIETLLSYGVDRKKMLVGGDFVAAWDSLLANLAPQHRAWMARLPLSCERGPYFFCHAGVRPGVPLSAQTSEDLLWIREEFLASRRPFGKIVVHGHTPVEEPEILFNRINVDTGAYMSGRLTAAVVTDEGVRTISTDR
jgi:serine/threonine protein phosphatase 1